MNEIKINNPSSLFVDKWEDISQDEMMITTADGITEPYYRFDDDHYGKVYYKNGAETKMVIAKDDPKDGQIYHVYEDIVPFTPENIEFSKRWWKEVLQLNEVSNAEVIDRVVTGFKLVRDTKAFGNAYRTKTGKATIDLAKRINAWIKTNFPNNNINTHNGR